MLRPLLIIVLLATSSIVSAIVIRDDVDDAKYRIPAFEFPALVDMPGEGHGVLIAPQWVVTAAHVLPMHDDGWYVVVDATPRNVERSRWQAPASSCEQANRLNRCHETGFLSRSAQV
jgi:hypothetical protein